MDLLRGRGFYCAYGEKAAVVNDEILRYYVRGDTDAWLESRRAETWAQAAVTEPVSVAEMHAWLKNHPGTFIAALPD